MFLSLIDLVFYSPWILERKEQNDRSMPLTLKVRSYSVNEKKYFGTYESLRVDTRGNTGYVKPPIFFNAYSTSVDCALTILVFILLEN